MTIYSARHDKKSLRANLVFGAIQIFSDGNNAAATDADVRAHCIGCSDNGATANNQIVSLHGLS